METTTDRLRTRSSFAEVSSNLARLAIQAQALSDNLNKLHRQCGHDSTSTDIADAAAELQTLATALTNLDLAVKAHEERYTDAFAQDVAEVQDSLGGIFEDIEDCCVEMQKANSLNGSAVGWLTKRRYVKKLQKHLEANKTTVIIMHTVISDSKEYGAQNSPGRLAESSPHTMRESLAILETVFASRKAIRDLRGLGSKTHEHTRSTSSAGSFDTTPSFRPGAHGRNLSTATGVYVPIIEDVLPMPEKSKKQEELARRFSRRGVRLAVHSSIMDTNAHDVPISLRNKWIRHAHLRRGSDRFDAASPSIAQLSRISEVNSNPGLDEPPPTSSRQQALTTSEHTSESVSPDRASSRASSVSDRLRERSSSLRSSPLGRRLGNLISRLSSTNLRERNVSDARRSDAVEQSAYPPSENKNQGDPEKKDTGPAAKKEMSAKEKPGWSYRLTRPFVKEGLRTPDFERGF